MVMPSPDARNPTWATGCVLFRMRMMRAAQSMCQHQPRAAWAGSSGGYRGEEELDGREGEYAEAALALLKVLILACRSQRV